MIFAVDYDGTCTETNAFPELGTLKDGCVQVLNELKEKGHQIVLNTCRDGKYLEEAVNFLRESGVEFDAVNKNCFDNPSLSTKICANVYLDDAAWPFIMRNFQAWWLIRKQYVEDSDVHFACEYEED